MTIIKVTMSLKSPEDTQWSDICSVSGVSPESWERRTRPPPPGEPEVGFLLLFRVVIADVIVIVVSSCYCFWFFVLLWLMLQALQKKITLKSIPPGPAKVGVVGVNNVCIKKCNKFLEPKNESFSALADTVCPYFCWQDLQLKPFFSSSNFPSATQWEGFFFQWEGFFPSGKVFFPVGRCCQGY